MESERDYTTQYISDYNDPLGIMSNMLDYYDYYWTPNITGIIMIQ